MLSPLLSVRALEIDVDVPGVGYCRAVDGVSFDVARGECLALVGESGCGKSLTLLATLGLLPERGVLWTGGEVAWEGVVIQHTETLAALRGRKIGYVPQDPMTSLIPVLRVGDQVAEAVAVARRVGRREARALAVELMEQVGLPAVRERYTAYPHELSGGQRQRVLIAIALAGDPELLIADEPTTALDVTLQAQVLELLRALQERRALGLVLVTHDLGVVEAAADRVCVLYAGRIVESGTVHDVVSAPLHPYTQGLLASSPAHAVPGRRLHAIPGAVPPPGADLSGCRFRGRCGRATVECARTDVRLTEADGGRAAACLPSLWGRMAESRS